MWDWIKAKWTFLTGKGRGILLLLLVVVILGVVAFWGSTALAESWPVASKALNLAGSVMLGTGFATLLSRTSWWQDAAESVMKDLATRFEGPLRSVLTLGMAEVVWFDDAIPWARWLSSTRRLEVIVIAGRTLYINETRAVVEAFLRRGDTELVAVFANPDDGNLMTFYDTAFNEDAGTRAGKIREAMRHVRELATNAGASGRVTVRVARRPLHFALYRFGDRVLYTPIWSKPNKAPQRIPGMLFGPGDMTRRALNDEVDFIVSDEGSTVVP
jgi:hypothetical protein